MPRGNRKKTFVERLYHTNVLTDGNLRPVEPIDLVINRLENPALDEEKDENEKGSV